MTDLSCEHFQIIDLRNLPGYITDQFKLLLTPILQLGLNTSIQHQTDHRAERFKLLMCIFIKRHASLQDHAAKILITMV